MEIKRCAKGHFYDAEANAFCPQCAAEQGFGGSKDFGGTEGLGGMEDYGATEPLGAMGGMGDYGPTEPAGGLGGMGDYGPTEPAGAMGGMEDYGATEPLGGFAGADPGVTMPVDGGSGFTTGGFANPGFQGGVENYDEVTRPIPPAGGKGGSAPGFMPVVGWLVCIEGPARGADYRIRAGYNYIGRVQHMDICVRGDNTIGRERHALVAYDQEERVFFFGPADGKSIVRLNGKMVMNPQEIKLHDVLTVGTTKLMFVPLCGEGFDWNGN